MAVSLCANQIEFQMKHEELNQADGTQQEKRPASSLFALEQSPLPKKPRALFAQTSDSLPDQWCVQGSSTAQLAAAPSTPPSKPRAILSQTSDSLPDKTVMGSPTPAFAAATPATPAPKLRAEGGCLGEASTSSLAATPAAKLPPQTPTKSAGLPYPLVGREKECKVLDSFLENCLGETESTEAASKGCLYVSGGPGTGKTCSVRAAAANWKKASPKTEILEINCIKLDQHTPIEFLMKLGQEAEAKSDEFPISILNRSSTLGALRAAVVERLANLGSSVVIVADEVDNLLGSRSAKNPQSKLEVIFSLVREPMAPKIAFVAIANSVDLLQRAEVATSCQSILFEPYSKDQLREIFQASPQKAATEGSDKEAKLAKVQVELKIRQVATRSGDCRQMAGLAQDLYGLTPEKKSRANKGLDPMSTLVGMPLETQVLLAILSAHKGASMPFLTLMTKFKAATKTLHMAGLQLGRTEVRHKLSFVEAQGLLCVRQKVNRGKKDKSADDLTAVELRVSCKALQEALMKANASIKTLLA
mmetsp:Transcript_70103/g.146616  ORF Transcript_70103/g.146616 Transcript_70103/m.146616 type:complete len:533 (-) Transcript_70103:668-2266(-)